VTSTEPARRTTGRIRIRWIRVAGLVVVIAAMAAALGAWPASSTTSSRTHVLVPEDQRAPRTLPRKLRGAPGEVDGPVPRSGHGGAYGEADGAIPAGTTVFDDDVPGVAKLDPALLGALRRAASDAARDGVTFNVNSGWRSAAYEDQLRREAIARYGSVEEAARWVATGSTSPHVKGDAVDIGPSGAAAWLSEHGAAYGLCPIYANEPWHYELRPEAGEEGCPAVYADPTQDPRMQR
jgi:zinc D-Ala-D-Ala carboxypeptidase